MNFQNYFSQLCYIWEALGMYRGVFLYIWYYSRTIHVPNSLACISLGYELVLHLFVHYLSIRFDIDSYYFTCSSPAKSRYANKTRKREITFTWHFGHVYVAHFFPILQESNRAVTKKEGINFARDYGCLFIECSAKTRVNVQQCFEELVLKVWREI